MGFFGWFKHPLVAELDKLERQHRISAAVILIAYDYVREVVQSHILPVAMEGAVDPNVQARHALNLRDEAVVALMRCCTTPDHDKSGKLGSAPVFSIPAVAGTLVLGELNERRGRSVRSTIDTCSYSKRPDEARVQLVLEWRQILGRQDSEFVSGCNNQLFIERWNQAVTSFIAGYLLGVSRLSDDDVLERAGAVVRKVPRHQHANVIYILRRLAAAPLVEDGPAAGTLGGKLF